MVEGLSRTGANPTPGVEARAGTTPHRRTNTYQSYRRAPCNITEPTLGPGVPASDIGLNRCRHADRSAVLLVKPRYLVLECLNRFRRDRQSVRPKVIAPALINNTETIQAENRGKGRGSFRLPRPCQSLRLGYLFGGHLGRDEVWACECPSLASQSLAPQLRSGRLLLELGCENFCAVIC